MSTSLFISQDQIAILFDGNHRSLNDSTPLVCPEGSFKSKVSNQERGRRICVGPNTIFWPIRIDGKDLGKVTSAVYSPRLKKNIALAMIDINHSSLGAELEVCTDFGILKSIIVEKPFFDPKKNITSA